MECTSTSSPRYEHGGVFLFLSSRASALQSWPRFCRVIDEVLTCFSPLLIPACVKGFRLPVAIDFTVDEALAFARDKPFNGLVRDYNSPFIGKRNRHYLKETLDSLQPGQYMKGTVFDEMFDLLRQTFPDSTVSLCDFTYYTAVTDRLGIFKGCAIDPSAMKKAAGNWIINRSK